ncbi:dynamin-1-like protein [Citrus sinensis]|nr:dynamin-1-like protein [Citrus sinensis]
MGEEASFSNKNVAASTTIGSSVIPIINRLQDIFSPVDGELSKISLPQVAVVGSQSSGKSSVLEALVGRDFLPRGCDICTRRPLALMLVNRPRNPGDDGREWAEFRHLPGKRFFDFTKVRQEIMAETNKEAGSNRGVSEKQIGLKISSPNVLNMTLVDLPGITKVPVGDQPTDIEARIRKMIMAYIRQENCIILAVSPANSDLATSDALQMAREADPTGSRTIGVITKLDIMDRGTNACNFLLGKVVPLRLGYVGVVNRSQEVYNGLSDRCGIPQLAKKLNQILEQHIRMVLPGLKSELHSRLNAVAKELQKYGDVMESKEVDPCQDLTDEDIRTAIQNATGPRNALFVPEVPFEVLVRRQIARLLDPCLQCLRFVYDELIKMSHACAVTELQRFPVLRRHLDDVMGKFIRDSVRPAERMIDSLIEIEMDYINSSHPNFVGGKKAVEVAMQQLKSSQDGTDGEKGTLSEIGQRFGLTSQLGNCNVGGNSSSRTWGFPIIFGGKVQAGESPASRSPHETLHNVEQLPSTIQLTEPPSILGPLEMTEQEAVEILVTKLLLQSYYDVVRKNVQDLVPKSIMHFLVNHAKRNLHNTFIQKLYRENHVEELLQEHDEVAANRRQVKEVSLVLQLAVQTLDEVESEYLPET